MFICERRHWISNVYIICNNGTSPFSLEEIYSSFIFDQIGAFSTMFQYMMDNKYYYTLKICNFNWYLPTTTTLVQSTTYQATATKLKSYVAMV